MKFLVCPNSSDIALAVLPDLDTVYWSEDVGAITLRIMLGGIDEDVLPTDESMFDDLLFAFGAWESLADMLVACAYREPVGTRRHLRLV